MQIIYKRNDTFKVYVEALLKNTKLNKTKNECREIVEIILENISYALENDEDVYIYGFGKFTIKNKRIKIGYNPIIKKEIIVNKSVVFKPSEKLKERVNIMEPTKKVPLKTATIYKSPCSNIKNF